MSELETLLGYEFKDKALLEKAFTHSTYTQLHGGENYELLEFLGDSILDFVIAEELMNRYPDSGVGDLTKMRGATVSKRPLAQVVRERGYDRFIKVGFGDISEKMSSDVFEAVTCAIYLDGGMEKAKQFVLENLNELLNSAKENSQKDFKSKLFEMYGNDKVKFVCKDRSGPGHRPIFTMELYVGGKLVSTGSGGDKDSAEQACAKSFLNL